MARAVQVHTLLIHLGLMNPAFVLADKSREVNFMGMTPAPNRSFSGTGRRGSVSRFTLALLAVSQPSTNDFSLLSA